MRLLVLSYLLLISSLSYSSQTILVLGDSLSAGYGIKIEESWPVLLQQKLNKESLNYIVHNASISGQTSAEGLRQIDQLLQLTKPDLVILELGANDGLRGLPLNQMQLNLQAIINKSLQADSKVLLVGVRMPNNFGKRFGKMFAQTFEKVAKSSQIPLIPFLLEPLEDVITAENKSDYIQRDGLHPTAKAQPLLLEHVWPSILPLLK